MFTSDNKNTVAQEILNIIIRLQEENKITDEEGKVNDMSDSLTIPKLISTINLLVNF